MACFSKLRLYREGPDGYGRNKDETAVHGCHCQGDMAVRMRKVLQTAGLVFECVTCFFRVSKQCMAFSQIEALLSLKNAWLPPIFFLYAKSTC